MHSTFRISNSSERLGLDLGCPSIHSLQANKKSEDLRIYVEPRLQCRKLLPFTEEGQQEDDCSSLLRVEPHDFTLTATTLSPELLAAEEKQRVREAAALLAKKVEPKEIETKDEPEAEPVITNGEQRRKSIGQNVKPNKPVKPCRTEEQKQRRREKAQALAAANGGKAGVVKAAKQPPTQPTQQTQQPTQQPAQSTPLPTQPPLPTIPPIQPPLSTQPIQPVAAPTLPLTPTHTAPLPISVPTQITPLPPRPSANIPALPTTPIPMGELPPNCIRSPPMHPSPINPLLSNLTPIPPTPPKQYVTKTPTTSSTSTPNSPQLLQSQQLISIQVPMAGPDGTQTLQTINVPRSVLAGASDRPILLTVTPKNGINKGLKQIVVLTKNTTTGNTTAGLARPNVLPPVSSASPASNPAPAHQESPSKAVHLSPRPGPSPNTQTIPQLVVRQQQQTVHKPLTNVSAAAAAAVPTVMRAVMTGGQQQQPSSPLQTARVSAVPALPVPRAVPLATTQQGVRVGNPTSSPAPRPVPTTSVAAPRAPAPPVQVQRTPGLVSTQQPVVRTLAAPVRPSAPSVLRGQLIQTPQGQVLVQGDRRIFLGPNSVVQGNKLVLTAAQMAALTGIPQTPSPAPQQQRQTVLQGTRVVGSQVNQVTQVPTMTRHQVGGLTSVSSLGSQLVLGGQLVTQQSSASSNGALSDSSVTLGSVASSSGTGSIVGGIQPLVGGVSPMVAGTQSVSPGVTSLAAGGNLQSLGGVEHLLGGGGDQSNQATPSSSGEPSSLSRILAALHNRGLVSQQNGKFYYVGDRSRTPVSLTNTGAAIKLSSTATSSPLSYCASSTTSPLAYSAATTVSSLHSTSNTVSKSGTSTVSHDQQQTNSQIVIPGAGLSLDSISASPHMLKMASTLLLGGVSGVSAGTLSPATPSNGTISSPVKMPVLPTSTLRLATVPSSLTTPQPSPLKLEGAKQTFYYRDPVLPLGWYIRIDRTQVGENRYQVDTAYFSPDGALLRSQSELAGYLAGRLIVRDKSHRPPVSVSRLPWKDDLIDSNKLFVPNIDNLANIVGGHQPIPAFSGSSLGGVLKRSGDPGGGGDEKRPCPDPQGPLPLYTL